MKRPADLDMIGRYELIEPVGSGGFGTVYRGRDPYIGRDLAVKVSSLDDIGGDRTQLQSFLRKLFLEAEAAGQLLHPNIVTIYDVGIEEPYSYIAMEFVEGKSLRYHCDPDRRLALADAIDVVMHVAHGLDYAHQRGIIHRDIKPTNILMGKRGAVKIADFGLAYVAAIKESQLAFAGTPSYMAPEIIRRELPTAKSDLFALGVVLYELLAGEKPFAGSGVDEITAAILKEPPSPLDQYVHDLPHALVAVVERALEKDPASRYQDAMEMARDLGEVLKGDGTALEGSQREKVRALRSLVFFSECSDEEVVRILQIGTWLDCGAAEVIVEQKEQDASFYVIVSGTAAVLKGEKKLGEMGRGQCFGEISFLLDAGRSATVTAMTDCQVLKLNAKKIDILPIETQVKLYRIFARTLANRLLLADQRTASAAP